MPTTLFNAELNDFKMVYNVLKSILFKEVTDSSNKYNFSIFLRFGSMPFFNQLKRDCN